MSKQPKPTQPDESSIRDAAVERALHFILRRMGWNPSVLAREAGVARNVAQRAVLGDVPSLATLRRLCDALGFDLWLFLLMGDLFSKDDLEHSKVSEAHTLIVKGVNCLLEAEGEQSTGRVMNELKLGLRDSGRAGDLPASPGVIDRLTLTTPRLFVERVVVDVPDLGGGSAGETVFDVLAGGASLYPSSATDDQRPRFAFDAAELAHAGSVPEVRELRRGDEITFATAEHATDGTPPRARLQIFGWAV